MVLRSMAECLYSSLSGGERASNHQRCFWNQDLARLAGESLWCQFLVDAVLYLGEDWLFLLGVVDPQLGGLLDVGCLQCSWVGSGQ